MSKIKIILINGTRLAGKDTFFNLLKEYNGAVRFRRFAFADALKNMLDDVCHGLFGKFINQLTSEEKEIFRPIMISTGEAARRINKDFWVQKVADDIQIFTEANPNLIPVITDARYISEVNYFKKIYGDSMLLVHVDRNGKPEPTKEEEINGPEVAKLADYSLTWHSDPSLVTLRPIVADFYLKYLT